MTMFRLWYYVSIEIVTTRLLVLAATLCIRVSGVSAMMVSAGTQSGPSSM